MASFEDINPREHKSRNLGQLIYDWWRRLRIGVNIMFLGLYFAALHLAGVLKTYAQVFYSDETIEVLNQEGQVVKSLLYEQGEVRTVIIKTIFFVVITFGFAAAMFYLPSGRVRRSGSD